MASMVYMLPGLNDVKPDELVRSGISALGRGTALGVAWSVEAQVPDNEERLFALARGKQAEHVGVLNVACPGCGSMDLSETLRQTSSRDEGMTTYYECNACGRKWR